MIPKSEQSCKSCYYGKIHDIFQCRRYPPKDVNTDPSRPDVFRSVYPSPSFGDWCGEWRPKD